MNAAPKQKKMDTCINCNFYKYDLIVDPLILSRRLGTFFIWKCPLFVQTMRNKINKSFSPKSANPPFCCFYAKEFLEKVALENNFLFTANPLLEKIMLTNLYLFQNDYRMIIEYYFLCVTGLTSDYRAILTHFSKNLFTKF